MPLRHSRSATEHGINLLWDLFCIVSIVGIWPRFVEPNMIRTTRLTLPIENLPSALDGFTIVQFSDLHLDRSVPGHFLRKLTRHINALKPDLLVFTGDFISYSSLTDPKRLKDVFQRIHAPHGCYAILGNHDYSEYVGINDEGDYDLVERAQLEIVKGFKRLLNETKLTKKIAERVTRLKLHTDLMDLLHDTSFILLENMTRQIAVKDTFLNITGLGEYTAGRCLPETAFQMYDRAYPGIVLEHNPDAAPVLAHYPGDLILCGHIHGGQINLPGFGNRFTTMEHPEYKRGLFQLADKWLYVNRGVGGSFRFRWFSVPEVTHITLRKKQS